MPNKNRNWQHLCGSCNFVVPTSEVKKQTAEDSLNVCISKDSLTILLWRSILSKFFFIGLCKWSTTKYCSAHKKPHYKFTVTTPSKYNWVIENCSEVSFFKHEKYDRILHELCAFDSKDYQEMLGYKIC